MAKQQVNPLAKYQRELVEGWNKFKDTPVELDSFGSLPEGIENGVARLTMAKIGVHKDGDLAGEPYFMMQASVIQPHKGPKGEPCAGLFTKVGPEPLCATPKANKRKTFEDHLGLIMNHLKMLGVNTAKVQPLNLQVVLAALVKAAPYIRFRTWKGKKTEEYPNPRVQETWQGILVDFSEDDDGSGSVQEGVEPPVSGEAFNEFPDGPQAAEEPADETDGKDTDTTEAPNVVDWSASDDLDALAEAGDQMVRAAQKRLKQLASKAGVPDDEAANADNWITVVEMIRAATTEAPEPDGEEPAEPEKPWEPVKEEVYLYRPIDQKTGKPKVNKEGKPVKAFEVEVTAVQKKSRTVTLLNNVDRKTVYKDVSWEALAPTP